jgi:xylulokinase
MLLGIDLGTGSTKALLLSLDGAVIAEASAPYPVNAPQPGWAETQPQDWWSAVAIAVKSAVQGYADQVQAIGLSGQMHGVVLTNEIGQPLYPAILWADTRSSSILSAYEHLDAAQRQALANPITAGMAGSTLLWLQQHEPELYRKARWVFQPKDWLRFQLTGTVAAEPSDASGTLLYDVMSDRWAVPVLDALKLRTDWLPEIIPSSQIAGRLTLQAAAQLNLSADVPVVAGAADTAAALLGSGLVEAGSMQLTVGTGAQIVSPRSQPISDPQGQTHLYRTALPQQWYTLAAMQNAGLALEWVRNCLNLSWSQVYAEAFTIPAGCEGLSFLPYLTGERTPHLDPKIRGAWVGLGLHHTRAHLMRSALEGVAFSLRQGLDAIVATGITPTHLRLAGGGTLEPEWRQLLADVLQLPLHRVSISAASARGAAILAGIGIGLTVDDLLSNSDVTTSDSAAQLVTQPQPFTPALAEAWQRFCSLYPALRSLSV